MKLFLIGFDDDIAPQVRQELLGRWASITAEFAGISAAMRGVLLMEKESCLFVVLVRSADDLDDVRRLTEKWPGRPVLALLEEHCDASLIVKAIRAGASQVVKCPIHSEDIREALDCIAAQFDMGRNLGKVIAVSGATGGCGATTVALNLAAQIAHQKHAPCILTELSLRMGVLATYLDIEPAYTSTDLVSRLDRLDNYLVQQSLTRVDDNLLVLPGPYHAIETDATAPLDVLKLVDVLKHLAPVVVLDVPATYDELFFRALSLADKAVLVVEPKVAPLRAAQLVAAGMTSGKPLDFVINRYNPKGNGLTLEKLQGVLKNDRLTTVAEDEVLLAAANRGQLLRHHQPSAPALASFDSLMHKLLDAETSVEVQEKSGLLGRLNRILSFS
jgi:pilus assembly protein CpaE